MLSFYWMEAPGNRQSIAEEYMNTPCTYIIQTIYTEIQKKSLFLRNMT